MFGFKAYFWNDRVTIGGETYRSNEILTACLNVNTEEFSGYLNELIAAKKKLLLREDPGVDFCDEYNGHVQRAQSLFFKIEEIVEELPPYRKLSVNPSDAPPRTEKDIITFITRNLNRAFPHLRTRTRRYCLSSGRPTNPSALSLTAISR